MNEARALGYAGLPNEAVLRMATVGSATALWISGHVGTLERGMTADCVLLEGDPNADIEALSGVSLVVKEGCIVYQRDQGASRSA
jgi:imidazolonepropionase-like amidohydrolase